MGDYVRFTGTRERGDRLRMALMLPIPKLPMFPVAIRDWSLTSLQQRLLKTGGRLVRHAPYFTLRLADSYPPSDPRTHRAAGVASDMIARTASARVDPTRAEASPREEINARRGPRGVGIRGAEPAKASLIIGRRFSTGTLLRAAIHPCSEIVHRMRGGKRFA